MVEITNRAEIKAQRLALLRGLGYILTGGILILTTLVFSGIALDFLQKSPTVNPLAPALVFFVLLLTGTIWGAIFMWKGYAMVPSRGQVKLGDQEENK